ncbi:PREDICTED: dimethylaniline monooxygenase [N-oxide-forming] 5-like [Branchiostoma belcheri]|uniref:Flavin-containing monooxygenase n=1 Tax=Branchiostoma belcheri TaxID=7741 RepID=A0A6P5A1D5_BRABE|nr:PREDICTED: dimethylaniline monooxygenase [N-oxide-forming] 5-like [Branchiostoma belcheri]
MAKKVAVIGSGASGLAAMKCCLDEGLQPVCFEKGTDIGGLWNFREDALPGFASVYRSTVINTSKEMSSYSDFPIPKEYPNFMHHSWVIKYFRLYADNFGLIKHIRFRHHVDHVKPREDFSQTGQWDVTYTNEKKGNTSTEIFDAVMVCTGHHVYPNYPRDSFPGIDHFQGKTLHSHDYKDQRGFENKRVVVIGIGNSGGDIAVELSRHAKQVYLSTRRGAWIHDRVSDHGLPFDIAKSSRFQRTTFGWLPLSLRLKLIHDRLNQRFDHALYGLQPEHHFFSQNPTVNDDMPNRIMTGSLIVKPNIKRFTETGVVFEDDTVEDGVDAVVFATGYRFDFPFIDESVMKVKNNQVDLYKYVFPPNLDPPTLSIIGLVQPLGSVMPISEMQSRWATRVFKGVDRLPSQDAMCDDIRQKAAAMSRRYYSSPRHTIQVEYTPYMDELAGQIGVKPDFKRLFLSDPRLAMEVYFGPCTPYQYRLVGPGAWEGAGQAIRTQWDRITFPTKTRPVKVPAGARAKSGGMPPGILKLLVLLVLVVAILFTF